MGTFQVLAITRNTDIPDLLRRELPGEEFEVWTLPDPGALDGDLLQRRTEIAVVEITDNHDLLGMAILALRAANEDVRIVALSRQSSLKDGDLVARKLFYYLSGDWEPHLAALVRAAAVDYQRHHDRYHRW